MAEIGGNIKGLIQTKNTIKNAIGESVPVWSDKFSQIGWLGMQSGGKNSNNFNAKIEETTHVFLCDFHSGIYALSLPDPGTKKERDCRMIIKGVVYNVLLIDNPDEMNEQLEIYLKRVGAWNEN